MKQNIPVIHGQFQDDINYERLIKESFQYIEKVRVLNDKTGKTKVKTKKYRR